MNKAVGFVPASLQNSAHRKGEKSLSGKLGREERRGSSPRIATAALDDLLDHPEGVL